MADEDLYRRNDDSEDEPEDFPELDDEDEEYFDEEDPDIDTSLKKKSNDEEIEVDNSDEILLNTGDDDTEKKIEDLNVKVKRKTTTNIKFINQYEYSELFALLSNFLAYSQIKPPEDPNDRLDLASGSYYRIARRWLLFMKEKGLELPFKLKRQISGKIYEEINPSSLRIPFDYAFKDEGPDTLADDYANNFTMTPYKVPH